MIVIILVNVYTIRYNFIDKKLAEKKCQVLEIKPQYLIKPK